MNAHINPDKSLENSYASVIIDTDDVVATGAKYFSVLLNSIGGSFSTDATVENVILDKAFKNMTVDNIEVISDNKYYACRCCWCN